MARTKASTPRPHESTCAGWGGMRRSITVATSRRRKTPRTKGKCAMGYTCCTAMAMIYLLSSSPDSIIAESSLRRQEVAIPSKNRVVQPRALNVGGRYLAGGEVGFECLTALCQEMDRLFEDFSYGGGALRFWERAAEPAVEVSDTADAVVVKVQVPGVNKDDIQL